MKLRNICILLLCLPFLQGELLLQGQQFTPAEDQSSIQTLIEAAGKNQESFAIERRNYLCTSDISTKANIVAKGATASTVDSTYETFYVNGSPIRRLLSINQIPLDLNERTRETANVRKAIAASAVQSSPASVPWEKSLEGTVLRLATFSSPQIFKQGNRTILHLQFRGNTAIPPATDLERIAQALFGEIEIDKDRKILLSMSGTTQDDVKEGRRLLVPKDVEIVDYRANFQNEIPFPLAGGSFLRFKTVSDNADARKHWMERLERVTFRMESCRYAPELQKVLTTATASSPH